MRHLCTTRSFVSMLLSLADAEDVWRRWRSSPAGTFMQGGMQLQLQQHHHSATLPLSSSLHQHQRHYQDSSLLLRVAPHPYLKPWITLVILHVAVLQRQTAHIPVIAEQPGVTGAEVGLTLSVARAKQTLQMLLLHSTQTPDLYTGSFLAASWCSYR